MKGEIMAWLSYLSKAVICLFQMYDFWMWENIPITNMCGVNAMNLCHIKFTRHRIFKKV